MTGTPRGTFVAVVGPSGAGKDTLIRAALTWRPDLVTVRRVVSRPPDDETEVFESVTPEAFARRRRAGEFALDWDAHGLSYAVPATVDAALAGGQSVLANLSRAVIPAARARFQPFRAILVTAPVEVLAARLAERGRESAAEIAGRLRRAAAGMPEGGDVVTVENAGDLDSAVAQFLDALPQPVSA